MGLVIKGMPYSHVSGFNLVPAEITTAMLPITLEEAKTFLRVNHDEDDAIIQGYIITAIKDIEDYTHRAVVQRPHTLHLDFATGKVEIPRPPIVSVDSPTGLDVHGYETKWIDIEDIEDLTLEYTAGYDPVPDDLQSAILNQLPVYYTQSQMAEGLKVMQHSMLAWQTHAIAENYLYHYNTI